MERIGIRQLSICAAFAAGEGFAAAYACCAECWPIPLFAAALAACFGYGLSIRLWRHAAVFFVGASLVWSASVDLQRDYRVRPWMRDAPLRGGCIERRSSVKADISRRMGIGLSPDREAVSLNRAILLGEKWRINRDARRAFVDSGTIHVFAVSGLHVMVVAKVLTVLFALMFVPARFLGVCAAPFVWAYVAMVGWPPSAVRAAAMATVAGCAPAFWRKPSGVASWSVAFLGAHIVNPLQISNVGSQLSFAVMLSLIMAGGLASGMRRTLLKSLWLTLAAWLAGVPIAAYAFGRISPGALLANVFLVAAASFSVAAGTVGVLASYVSDGLAAHCNNLAAVAMDCMVMVSRIVAGLPGASVTVPCWGAWTCAGWYAAVGLLYWLLRKIQLRRDLL